MACAEVPAPHDNYIQIKTYSKTFHETLIYTDDTTVHVSSCECKVVSAFWLKLGFCEFAKYK